MNGSNERSQGVTIRRGNGRRAGPGRGTAAFIATLLLTLAATPASASEQSQLLTAQGLAEFKQEHYAQAAALFDQARQADSDDAFALYYRGVTRSRLGEYERAIADLELFLDAHPEQDQAALELGVALVSARRYTDAEPWLRRAQAVPELDGRASFFLGLAELRLGQAAAAEQSFQRALQDQSLVPAARFYLGKIAFDRGDWDAATDDFAFVNDASPRSDMGGEARRYLDVIAQNRTSYHLHGELGLAYDSNVVLAPSDGADAAAISGKADGLVTITVGGDYTPWRSAQSSLSGGYEFYQSLHFDLSDYDLQDHRVHLGGATRLGRWELGLGGQYDFYLLDGDALLQQPAVSPWVRFSEGDFGYTEMAYWFRWRDYVDSTYEDDLDALRQSVGLRQYVFLDSTDRSAWLEYRFDRSSAIHAAGRRFAYNRNEVGTGIDWRWRALGIDSSLAYWYNHDGYDSASRSVDQTTGEVGPTRKDNRNTVEVSLSKSLTKHVAVRCAYAGIFNGSNQSLFEYDRNIVTLAVEVEF